MSESQEALNRLAREFARVGVDPSVGDAGRVTIYVVTYGDARHGTGIFGATIDGAEAERMAQRAEEHYHKCYGGPLCDRKLMWQNEGQRSREVYIRAFRGSRPDRRDNGAMTEKWEEGCDHHCGCVFVLLALADKLAEALRRHAHGGTDCGLCDEALSDYETAQSDGEAGG